MNGILAKALLNLIAKYVDEHGAELFDKLLAIILKKINPDAAAAAVGFSATEGPVAQEFGAAVDELIANPPTE